MEQVTASISLDGVSIVENTKAAVEIVQSGRLKEWHGYFSSPVGFPNLDPTKLYQLTTSDGRSGKIKLEGTIPYGDFKRTQIRFTGAGAFI